MDDKLSIEAVMKSLVCGGDNLGGDNLGGDKLLLDDKGGAEYRSLHNSILLFC